MSARDFFDADLRAGLKVGLCAGLVAVMVIVFLHGGRSSMGAPPPTSQQHRQVDFGDEVASIDVRRLANWIVASGDNGDRRFVLVDKRGAKVFVFEADGHLAGAAPVLLGSAIGDGTAPGVASKPLSQLRPEERTTPAGRFISQAGRNAEHEDVVWVDYDAAVSMHRVRLTEHSERRLERLASATVADNRISAGCINLPVAFFDHVVWPRFGGGRQGVVYVLPEILPLDAIFAVHAMAGR